VRWKIAEGRQNWDVLSCPSFERGWKRRTVLISGGTKLIEYWSRFSVASLAVWRPIGPIAWRGGGGAIRVCGAANVVRLVTDKIVEGWGYEQDGGAHIRWVANRDAVRIFHICTYVHYKYFDCKGNL